MVFYLLILEIYCHRQETVATSMKRFERKLELHFNSTSTPRLFLHWKSIWSQYGWMCGLKPLKRTMTWHDILSTSVDPSSIIIAQATLSIHFIRRVTVD